MAISTMQTACVKIPIQKRKQNKAHTYFVFTNLLREFFLSSLLL